MDIKEQVWASFYEIHGEWHTNVLSAIDFEEYEDQVHLAIYEMLAEGEFRYVYDDETKDASTAFLLYRKGNRLLMEYIFKEDDTYEYPLELSFWIYPKAKSLTAPEMAQFDLVLTKAIQEQDIPLVVTKKRMKKSSQTMLNQSAKDATLLSETEERRIKHLAYFFRYWVFLFMFGFFFLGGFLFGGSSGGLLGFGVFFLAYGAYTLLGAIKKFRHIYCMYQNAYHQEMTPNEIYWNTINKSDLYGLPIVMLVFGVGSLVVGIFGLLGIL